MAAEPQGSAPRLLPHNREHLHGSAIGDPVIDSAGYFSAGVTSDLVGYGWNGSTRLPALLPALAIPVRGAASEPGHVAYAILRPDTPIPNGDGKVRKYECPPGSTPRLDVHPLQRESLLDPTVRLWFVEGHKKAHSLVTIGEVAIALNGVFGFRSAAALADLDVIILRGRDVIVGFDSDVARKPGVRDAMRRLGGLLAAKGAAVQYLQLEDGGTEKIGVDDFLARGGTLTELEERLRDDVPALDDAAPPAPPRTFTVAEARLRVEESLEHLAVLGADGYIVRGWTHLLAGWWRLGKSELMAAVVLPWLRLGLRIVWLTEEPDSVWADRADVCDEIYDPVCWDRLTLVDAMSAEPAALLDYAAGVESDVVIVDTIRECCGIESMKDDDSVHRAMSPWLRRLRDGRRTLICLAQHRKAAGELGSRVLGSVALPSKFDIVLELEAVEGHERQRRLTVRRRRAQTSPLVYEMDAEDRIVAIPDARSRSRVEAEAAALAVVNASPEPLTSVEVRRRMAPAPSRDTVRRALTALSETGRILRDPPISEDAGRRTVRWLAALAQLNLAQNSYSLSGEFGAPDAVAPDLAANTPFTPTSAPAPAGPCSRCGQLGWHPPCRKAPNPLWNGAVTEESR